MAEGRGFPAAETQGPRFVRAAGVAPERLAALHAGEMVVLPVDLLAPCGRFEWAEQPVYASGYQVEDRADGRYFTSVVEGSPAWQAGLRPGMRYVRRVSFRFGDSRVPIVMRVGDAQGEREISWRPEGANRVRFQRLVLDEPSTAACRARLAGD